MTMNFSQFCDNWPESRKDQFSYQGKKAIFEYLEEYEESTGEQIEFDPIAICCEWTEYEDFTALQAEYSSIETMDDLKDNTIVLEIENSDAIVIQQF